jgi:hypothetical protein
MDPRPQIDGMRQLTAIASMSCDEMTIVEREDT